MDATCTTPAGPDGVGMQLVRLKRSMEAFRIRVQGSRTTGLEGSGLGVLHHLTTQGPVRTSRLAELLGLDPSTTSRHVAALERSGHVERVADPDDGRAWLVQASPAGHEAFSHARAVRTALVDRVLAGWEPAEVDAFAAALARFNDSVHRPRRPRGRRARRPPHRHHPHPSEGPPVSTSPTTPAPAGPPGATPSPRG